MKRSVGPPPENMSGGLFAFVDVLFDLDAEHHKRKHGKFSQKHSDLLQLCSMVNCTMLGDEWVHHCLNPDSGKPCCKNLADSVEKTTVSVINSLLGEADPIPAESRWTHVLMNMKKTLLRAAVFNIGIEAFNIPAPAVESNVDKDDEGSDAFFKFLHKTRIDKTTSYYFDARKMHELAVLTSLLECCDAELLYPLLGDPIRSLARPSKMDLLHDRDTSKIASCCQNLLGLMSYWNHGGPHRKPWSTLDVLKAP